jgi:hypothetical protein
MLLKALMICTCSKFASRCQARPGVGKSQLYITLYSTLGNIRRSKQALNEVRVICARLYHE